MVKRIDYNKELNRSQLEAVLSTEGPHLVIAGAGSGKTRVLIYRLAYLVQRGISPQAILLLTFTRKAASEMLRRASLILDERCNKVSGGTFHSFANMVLRRYAGLLNISNNFTILDTPDAEGAVNLVRTRMGLHKAHKRFPRKNTILDIISKSINKAAALEDVLYLEYPQFLEWKGEIEKIKAEYAAYKYANSLLDYDDLLVFLKRLLSEHDKIRGILSDSYKYIMVDEYQDTNKIQAQIVCLLRRENKNIMVVGDDSQSIYSFRGANFRNIMDFPKIFNGAKIITLEENYRSTQPILDMTNKIIDSAKDKFKKELFTRRPGKNFPVYVETQDEHEQSQFIVKKILQLREEGVELKDISVLFRSGWHSNDLEVELNSRGIPFIKYGGQKFIEAAHIKDIISYLKVCYNFSDEISWMRILSLLPKVGPKTAEKIIKEIIRAEKELVLEKAGPLFKKVPGLKPLFELLIRVRLCEDISAGEVLNLFLEYYLPLLKDKYDDFNKRINDMDSLARIAMRYGGLEGFLSDMALDPPEKTIIDRSRLDKEEPCLCLSTIHSAKGLEWHTVFILYLAEGHLPSYLSLADATAIEEERRLFYVAATRARDNLFLLKPNLEPSARRYYSEGFSMFTRVSRFLEEGNILADFVSTEAV